MDAKLTSRVDFLVGPDVPHKLLTEATELGLAAADAALGEKGRAQGNGSLIKLPDGRRRVRIDLAVRAAPQAALAAEAAFSSTFEARLRTKGFEVERA